jgi:hypothetical protein
MRRTGRTLTHRAARAVSPNTVAAVASNDEASTLATRWRCSFAGDMGEAAHAEFASFEQAKRFAEAHARASGALGSTAWVEAAEGVYVLQAEFGDYLVAQARTN